MRRETLQAFLLCTLVGFWCVTARGQTVATATTLDASAQSVCLGQAVTLTVTVTTDPAGSGIPTGSVDLLDGGNYVATTSLDPQGQGTFSVDWFDPGSHPLTAQYSGDPNFNGSLSSAPALLTVNPLPACSISGTDAVCASSLNQVYSAPPGLAAYRWSVTGSATIAGATNSSTVAINAGAAGTFTLNLSLTNASGCASTCSKTVSLTPLPTATVSGGGTICPGASANVQAALTGVSPWTLTWSDGFTQTVSSSPAVRSVSPVSTTTYAVSSVSGANCTGSSSGTAAVTVNTPATVTADPVSTAICNGSAVSFTSAATGNPAPKIQWQVSTDAGVTFANIPGATNTTYTFSTATTDDGKKFRAQFTNTCALVASAPALLSINPLPNCSIAGAGALCANLANQAYAAPAGLAAYRWSISGSAAISGAANASLITINVGASGTFTLTLTLTNATGCASTCSKTVSILALPTAVVSGGGGICPGNSATLQAALTGASPWTLTWSDGFTQTVSNSPATRSASPTSNSTYSVTSVADANCVNAGSGSASITINSSPVVTANPVNKSVCTGSPASFTAAATGSPTPSAQWQVSTDGGATFTNLAGASSSTYTFTTSLSDNAKRFRALFTNACGAALSSAATLTVNALPAATMTVDPIVCGGSTSNVVSVAPAGAGAGYAWTISGGTITSGAGTPTITYTAGASGSINISVTVSNAQGCSASASQSVALATSGKDLEAWRNKAPLQWQGSTFNDGDHQYSEGNSIPMRLELTQMCPGVPWSIVLRYDFKDGNTSRHFYDFLCTYDASELTVNGHELDSFRSAYPPTTFPIPVDSTLGYQLPGDFTVYNGMITNVSTYSVINGSTVEKQLVISGITTAGGGAKDVLILFGGHLGRENEWGPGNGASSFPGASAKVLYQFYGASAFANFAVNPAGIVKQADLSITKTAAPNPLCAGNTLTYSLVIANSGPNQASPVTVLDTLPAGMTVTSVSLSQGTWSGTGTLNLALGALNAGSNATATIVVTVNLAAAGGTVTNIATVSAGAPADPYNLNNTASAVTLIFPHPSASPLIDQAVCRGAPAAFSTIAIGAPPISYQWTRNGSLLPGATNSFYNIPAVSDADVGTYCVMVAAQCNNISDVITNCASLTISPATSTSALSDQVKCPGESASFSTTTAGTGPFALAWKKDGVLIPGATNSMLLLTNVSASDAGAYCVEVAGSCNPTSACARLVVLTNTAATPLVGQTNCLGDNVTFSTVASGSGPFAYVWRKDGTLISGQTASSLTLPSVTSAQAGNYCVEVTGNCNGVTNCASLLLWTSTTADPLVSQTNCPGATVVFSTTAHGDGPFTYQWAKDGLPLGGQTANSLTLTNASAANGGTYSVWVNGLCNGVTNSARLVINQNVYVATPLVNLTNCLGTSASFTAAAGGTGPLTYQWSKDGLTLPGQTNAALVLGSVTAPDAGTYSVQIAGTCGTAVTATATLKVNQDVVIATPPVSLTNCPGSSATFTVVPGGTGPFSYQWSRGGIPLPGQTNSILLLSNLGASDAGSYSVLIGGACGNAVSSSAYLAVNQTLVILSSPVSLTNCPGSTATFAVGAIGTGVSYQWYKGATALAGQTNNILTLPAVTAADDATYLVVVTGNCGSTVTNSASLSVNTPVTADPLISRTNCPGTSASFSTTAHGTGPFGYQWLKNGAPLGGQTAPSLTLSNPTGGDTATYSVQVTGACGSVTQAASLFVNTPVTADPLVSQTVCPGAALSLTTLAHGTGPFTYQWIKDGKPLPNATNNFWSIASATVLDDGAYVVIVTGPCNALTNNGTVTVHPPTTLTPLADQTLCFGATATFSTTPSGTGPFTFTWKKNGLVLAGQTTNTLTLPRVQASDAGTYSVEASGLCNSASSSATLAIESQGLVSPATFANPAPITINDFSAGSPYPSTIDVSCVSGPLSQLSVTLTNVSHTYASDIDILLVGPSGQAIMLMSDTGGANGLTNATLTFSDAALNFLPQNGPIASGVYKPTDYPPEDNMPVPAPLPPYATNLAAFSGTDANGTWSLYVVDDALMDTGMIAGGWSLTLSWTPALADQPVPPVLCCQAPAGMTLQGQAGHTYVIEASIDLVTWTPILTNTLSTPSWNLVDQDRTNFTHRFYRAVARP